MIFKKNFILLTLFLVIIFQALIYTNNNQKSTYRFFKWTVKEVSVGKLISISFFSGLITSTLLNIRISTYKKNNLKDVEEDYENYNNEEYIEPNLEMPPQRNIRDAQPTISVNYRVVKNTEENNLNKDKNYSSNPDEKDDWDNSDDDW